MDSESIGNVNILGEDGITNSFRYRNVFFLTYVVLVHLLQKKMYISNKKTFLEEILMSYIKML